MGKIYDELKKRQKLLCHMTEFKNLESILENGIISLKELENRGFEVKYITTPNSRTIDSYYKIDDYVRVAYTPYYDMIPANIYYGYVENPVIICISSDILLEKPGILFSDKNALGGEANLYENENEAYEHIDFDKTYTVRNIQNCNDVEYKDARQAEILIPHCIETKYIKHIVVEEGTDISGILRFGIPILEFPIKESYQQ